MDTRTSPFRLRIDKVRDALKAQGLAAVLDVTDELLDRLGLEQIRIHSASVDVDPPSRLCATADKRTLPSSGAGCWQTRAL